MFVRGDSRVYLSPSRRPKRINTYAYISAVFTKIHDDYDDDAATATLSTPRISITRVT